MLALLLLPALLGLAFIIDDDDDSTDDLDTASGEIETNTLTETETTSEGTDLGERTIGNALDNVLSGAGGDDILVGNGGDDLLNGDDGEDTLYGGSGNDTAYGGADDDQIFLGAGADEYSPGEAVSDGFDAGDDIVRGGAGADVIVDMLGSNNLTGDGGNDALAAIDALRDDGTFGPDSEFGTTDTLGGGLGDDTLIGDDGDVMNGGGGSDAFYAAIDESRTQDSVTITDFNVNRDTFAVVRLNETDVDEDVTFTHDSAANAVRAFFGGAEVAVLRGVAQADIDNISVAVLSESDLDARLAI